MRGNVSPWGGKCNLVNVLKILLYVSVLSLGVVAGCKTTYVMEVDALCTPGAEIFKTYTLVPGNKRVTPDDLEFLEFRKYVQRALEAIHCVESPKGQADVVIAMSYGISKPQQRIDSYSYPTYGYQYGRGYGPVYGATGYDTEIYSYEVYIHTLKLIARETRADAGGEGREVWRVVVTSTNMSNDLRSFFPYLVAAAQPFVANQTPGGAVEVKLKENADAVMLIRHGREAWEQMKKKDDDD